MTQQEILDTIALPIRIARAAGNTIDVHTDAQGRIKITPGSDMAFGCSFIDDLSGVCRENFIAFAIGAEVSPVLQPFILL